MISLVAPHENMYVAEMDSKNYLNLQLLSSLIESRRKKNVIEQAGKQAGRCLHTKLV